MVALQQTVTLSDDPSSIVSRRRTPRVYVTDATGDVLLRGVADGSLTPRTRATVMNLIASHPDEDVVLGLADTNDVLRLIRLRGEGRPCYALFLEAHATRSPVEAAARRFRLSDREREVLPYLLRGTPTADIAAALMIAESTVATHVRNIGAKMDASKRKEIVAAVLGGR